MNAMHASRPASLWKRMKKFKYLYLMFAPVVAYYIIFHYAGIYYAVIAFQNYKPMRGISGSAFVGFRHFSEFFSSVGAWRLVRNTLLLNALMLLFAFPASILFALMINQMRDSLYKKTIQTVTYMPHFIATVVVCGLISEFSQASQLLNDLLAFFGFQRKNLLSQPSYFRAIYVLSEIWQHLGWGTIIYLATLSGVDLSLHEAAAIDGAGRLRRIFHINLPALMPVITIQLILRIGRMMSLGHEKVLLLYNPLTYETADILSTFVYRRGLQEMDYSYGAAVGLFSSAVNLLLLIFANRFSKRATGSSVW